MADKKDAVKTLTLNVETIRRLTFGVQWAQGTQACRPPGLTVGCPSLQLITDCINCEGFLHKLGNEVRGQLLEPEDDGSDGDGEPEAS